MKLERGDSEMKIQGGEMRRRVMEMSQTRQEQISLDYLRIPDLTFRKDGDIDDSFLRQSQVRVGTCPPGFLIAARRYAGGQVRVP